MKIFFLGQKVKSLKDITVKRTYEINGRTESNDIVFKAGTFWTVNETPKKDGVFGMVNYMSPIPNWGYGLKADWYGTQEEAEEFFEPVWLSMDAAALV